jgi:SpoIIAA-like
MSVEITSNSGGMLTARISGKLTQPELAALQESAVGIIRQHGHVRILIIAEDFQGWQQDSDWSDVSFMENDPYIEKIAIVGEKKWEELALIFTAKLIRKFPIEYFQPADLARARDWLTAA